MEREGRGQVEGQRKWEGYGKGRVEGSDGKVNSKEWRRLGEGIWKTELGREKGSRAPTWRAGSA